MPRYAFRAPSAAWRVLRAANGHLRMRLRFIRRRARALDVAPVVTSPAVSRVACRLATRGVA
eukprot:3248702-Lingulodinium_polyedra.AAC.1